jgi:predicted ATPase/DNA-binding SARP family transcriptional activator
MRKDIPIEGLITTVPGGYRLDAATDLHTVDALVDEAGDAPTASVRGARLDDALALWRGEPFVDAADCVATERERAHWSERRLAVVELQQRAYIDCGEYMRVIDELASECADHPLRESLWALLIEAHYRSGNQDEALRSLKRLRADLIDELGASPGPTIVELEQRILIHAPELTTTTTAPSNRTRKRSGNVRIPATSFVGREDDLARLAALLDGGVRLLELVGPGGAGKTRLALELMRRRGEQEQPLDTVVSVVDLSVVDDGSQVTAQIIGTLGLQPRADLDDAEVIADACSLVPMILVFDTCEHVIAEASDLAEYLVAECPSLTIVATSRESLASPSATLYPVQPLGDTASVELFTERAGNTRAGFELTDANRAEVALICDRLGGSPLAIELVAARTSTLDVATIAGRVDEIIDLALDTRGGRVERQASLAATLDWSYHLLDDDEPALFDRLSVFIGGFTLDAVEGVCTDDLVTPERVVDLLERLVDKSLVVTADDEWTGRRYHLLDTTRDYGRRKLQDEADRWRRRHATHYAGWAGESAKQSMGEAAGGARRLVNLELGNLRLAAEWACTEIDIDTALALARITTVLTMNARYDGLAWLEPILDLPGVDDHPHAAAAIGAIAFQLDVIGRDERREELALRGMQISEQPIFHFLRSRHLRALAQRTAPPDPEVWKAAKDAARHAAALDRGETWLGTSLLLWFLADERAKDEFFELWPRLERALTTGSGPSRVTAANMLGALAVFDPERARAGLVEAIPRSVEYGMDGLTNRLRSHLALLESRSGDSSRAAGELVELIDDELARRATGFAMGYMRRLALVLAESGCHDEAVMLHHAIPDAKTWGWGGDSPERALDEARVRLGHDRYDECARRGDALDWEGLMELVRSTPKLIGDPHDPS